MAQTYTKQDPAAPPGFFEAEARGLRWLAAVADGVPVVDVHDVHPGRIVLRHLQTRAPTADAAATFGARLARTHRAGCPVWGSTEGDGFIGPLPLPNGPFASWPDLYWHGRVEPYLRAAVARGLLTSAEAASAQSSVASRASQVPATTPSRIHGDLWSGNVVWDGHGATLIDAGAAHGGHRETDLAMLALFGLPHLDSVLAAYDDEWPLDDGWQARVGLHQLHPLLVHVVLFGGGYVEQTRRVLRGLQ